MVYKMLFFFLQLYIFRWRILFFSIHKNTDSSQLYNLEEWVQLFSGRTNGGGTGVFHYASNFLLKDKVHTSHFVHPSLVMQVDAMCMKWQNCGDRKHPASLPLFFLNTPKQESHLCRSTDWLIMCFQRSSPSLPPHLPFFLFPLHTMFFRTTLLLHPCLFSRDPSPQNGAANGKFPW